MDYSHVVIDSKTSLAWRGGLLAVSPGSPGAV